MLHSWRYFNKEDSLVLFPLWKKTWAPNPLIILPDLNLTLILHDKLRFCIFSPLLFGVICLTQHCINRSDSLSDSKAFHLGKVGLAPRVANSANCHLTRGHPDLETMWVLLEWLLLETHLLKERHLIRLISCRVPGTATTSLHLEYFQCLTCPPPKQTNKKLSLRGSR